MNVRYALLCPVLLTTATVTYVLAGPFRGSQRSAQAEEVVAASKTLNPADTGTPEATPPATPIETATREPSHGLPNGLAGQLTYLMGTGRQLVTVQFPDTTEISREADPRVSAGDLSADGLWRVSQECPDIASCVITLTSADGATSTEIRPTPDYAGFAQWSPDGHTLAYLVTPAGGAGSRDLVLVDDPAVPQPRVILNADGYGIFGFTWLEGGRLLASLGGGAADHPHLVAVTTDGVQERLVDTPQTVTYFYPSPGSADIAFTQQEPEGWRLFVYATNAGTLRDLGNMGSDGPGGAPVVVAPDVKGPMYIGWSPDGTRVAFGGGFEPPYVMTTIDLRSGEVLRTEFPGGYPGEIKWSPDGARIAVSAYNVPRTHHESYIVDPATGVATDVLSGCVIVWSPDSRFLAIHGEKIPGVAIADVLTLEHSQLTHGVGDTPLWWMP
jgi:WD40 repeat protein